MCKRLGSTYETPLHISLSVPAAMNINFPSLLDLSGSKKPTGSFEFSVPSTKDVHRVLIISVLAAIVWVIMSQFWIYIVTGSESHAHGLWSLIGLMGMSVLVAVPCWGLVWLLLAAPSRSHSKGYYIRYRLTQVLAFIVYFSVLQAEIAHPIKHSATVFTDPEGWALIAIVHMVLYGIVIFIVSIPIVIFRSRKIQPLEVDSAVGHTTAEVLQTKEKSKKIPSIGALWVLITIFGILHAVLGSAASVLIS